MTDVCKMYEKRGVARSTKENRKELSKREFDDNMFVTNFQRRSKRSGTDGSDIPTKKIRKINKAEQKKADLMKQTAIMEGLMEKAEVETESVVSE